MVVKFDESRCVALAVGLDFVDSQRAQGLVARSIKTPRAAADDVTLSPCADVPFAIGWSPKNKRVAGSVGTVRPRSTRFVIDLKQDGIKIVA